MFFAKKMLLLSISLEFSTEMSKMNKFIYLPFIAKCNVYLCGGYGDRGRNLKPFLVPNTITFLFSTIVNSYYGIFAYKLKTILD